MTISFDELITAQANYTDKVAYHSPEWDNVLQLINDEEWTADEYLDYIFMVRRKPMLPSILLNKGVIEDFKVAREKRIADSYRRAAWALDQVKVKLNLGILLPALLVDKELHSFALLMYLLADTAKLDEFRDKYREAALYEMRTRPELIDIYSVKFTKGAFPNVTN